MDRLCIKITGESGSGLLSTGEIIMKALKNMGFYVVADREYPSLIKGGHACFIINVSLKPIRALAKRVDVMMAIDKQSLVVYFDDLKRGAGDSRLHGALASGLLIHGYERPLGVKDIHALAAERGVKVLHRMARDIAEENGGNVLMVNVVLAGMFWKALGLPYQYIEAEVTEQFKDKPKLLAIDLKCLKAGYEKVEVQMEVAARHGALASAAHSARHGALASAAHSARHGALASEVPGGVRGKAGKDGKKNDQGENSGGKSLLIDGNHALTLGAIHAGCRAYFAYPMSPSSSILTHFSEYAVKTGVLVKQVEDEISVVNMTLGAMYMGTRALCATSGGGFDLMTETVSLAGMIETPLVIVVAQRPGPATGLPTWTAQADLDLAVHAGHGEFPRVVMAVSDPSDCFELIQHAFNLAEKYQTVVLLLTEKVVAETNMNVPEFEMGKIKIERGLVRPDELKNLKNEDRYKVTADGLSKRWLPGTDGAYYFANGDEHWEDGSLLEDSPRTAVMYEKRMKKAELIEKNLPEPEIFGIKKNADISFIGWGRSKNVMLNVIAACGESGPSGRAGIKVNYLHYSYLFPLKTKVAEKFFKENKNVNLIEGNYNGQLGRMLEAALGGRVAGGSGKTDGKLFKNRMLKYDGRPFFVEEVEEFVKKNM